jgi:hypothetical protein
MPTVNPVSQPGIAWESVGGLGGTVELHKVSVSPSGVWVAARANVVGTVSRSTNYGTSWSNATTPSTDTFGSYGSTYGEGLFIVGDWGGNELYSSADGSTWTVRSTGSRDNYGVLYNDGYFVCGSGTAGGNGFANTSADGTTWVYGAQGSIGASSGTCGVYVSSLNRTFVGGTQYRYVNDIPTAATAWTGTPTGLSGRITDIAWSPTASIGVVTGPSGIYSSTDLITWTLRNSTTNMYGVSWCETQFVAVGAAGVIRTSPDGTTWTSRTSGTTNDLYGAASHNGVILVTGYGGTVLRSG